MSKETIEWLNENTLMGFCSDREKWAQGWTKNGGEFAVQPWHATEDYTGAYEGPIPVEAVMDRLFNWQAVEAETFVKLPATYETMTGTEDDGTPFRMKSIPGRKGIVRSDNGAVMFIGADGYTIHQYNEWLLDKVGTLLDTNTTDLGIASAGLLSGGGIAYVGLELPEAVDVGTTGFSVRPSLIATTSHNGKLATNYMLAATIPVCDNSLAAAYGEADKAGTRYKIKHTSGSANRIEDARQALGILFQATEEMTKFLTQLAEWEVGAKEFANVMNELCPVPEQVLDAGKVKNIRTITNAQNKRDSIAMLYYGDPRVTPWQGTALGVLQAFNTWNEHERINRGTQTVERQMMETLTGKVAEYDNFVLSTLSKVTDRQLAVAFA